MHTTPPHVLRAIQEDDMVLLSIMARKGAQTRRANREAVETLRREKENAKLGDTMRQAWLDPNDPVHYCPID